MNNDGPEVPTRRPGGERARRRALRRRRWLKLMTLLVVAVVAIALLRPAYRWVKARRADQLAEQGAMLAKFGKLNEAAGKYRAALQLDPLGYRALKGAAQLATKGNRPEALDLWEAVVHSPSSTTADREDYAAALLEKGRLSQAETIITPLLSTNPDTRTLNLAATYAVRTGDHDKAIAFARIAVSRAPQDDFAKVQLADLLAKSADNSLHLEARKILWSLAGHPGEYRKTAIEGLARAPELSVDEKQRVLPLLTDTPPVSLIDALLAADLRLQLEPNSADAIYEQVADTCARDADPKQIPDVARWLNAHGQADRVLRLVPTERARTSEPLLVARLDALASTSRWSEIEELLSESNLPVDAVLIEAFRARTATARNAPLDAELHWGKAITASGNDPARLRFVAHFAEQSNAPQVALKLYDQLARLPDEAVAAQANRERLLLHLGAGSAARAAAEKVVALSPADPNAQVQLIYLNLLANVDVAPNTEKAKALAAKFPDRLAYRVAAALGFLRQSDPAGALAQFKGPPIDWQRTPPRWRAVYAATLRESGDDAAALKLVATIRPEQLTEEERALIAPPTQP